MGVILDLQEHMREKRRYDKKQELLAQKKAAAEQAKDKYQKVKDENPGEEVYACVVTIQCPWSRCGRKLGVAEFLTIKMGNFFHVRCPDCRERVITLRDTVDIIGTNTFPVEFVKEWMEKKSGQYQAFCNQLLECYRKLDEVTPEALEQMRTRETNLTEGDNNNRPIKMKTTVETLDEAVEAMRVVNSRSTYESPLTSTSYQEAVDFFADPDVMSRYKV